MTCPLEKQMAAMLDACGISYRRPERDCYDPTTLDFHLVDFNIYVEVKQFHTPRIADQLAKVPVGTTVVLLMGARSVADFGRLCQILGAGEASKDAA